ncbi:MAG: uroporphyrinogen decarboxylase family protein [Anaerolineae bacterium]
MGTMSKRERVLRTLAFQETDRVPIYDILQNDGLIEYLSGESLTVENGNHVKGRAIGNCLDMTRMPGGPAQPGIVHNEDGTVTQVERWTAWVIEHPWQNQQELAQWVERRIDQENKRLFDSAYRERFRQHSMYFQGLFGDDTVQIVESGAGLTEMYSPMGWETFAYLLVDEPELMEAWLESRNQAELRRVACIADPELIPIALTYDDIAYKTSTHVSPAWLRKYWLPRLKKLNAAWHERGTRCIFHSDGNLWGVLDDLIAAGIDGINPIEVQAGMTVGALRAKYPKLILTGGIDVSELLPFGTPEQVHAAALDNINATDGLGYFLGSSTELHWEIPTCNIMAMFEAAWHRAKR